MRQEINPISSKPSGSVGFHKDEIRETVEVNGKTSKSLGQVDFIIETINGSEFSVAYLDDAIQAVTMIPDPIADLLTTNDRTLRICKVIQDENPGIEKAKTQVIVDGIQLLAIHTMGYYAPDQKAIILPEYYEDFRTNYTVRNNEIADSLKHEFGHAVDDILKDKITGIVPSISDEFRALYIEDCQNVSNPDLNHPIYYSFLDEYNKTGQKEAFAYVFAALLGGRNANYFLKRFPLIAEFIRSTIVSKLLEEGWSEEDSYSVFTDVHNKNNPKPNSF